MAFVRAIAAAAGCNHEPGPQLDDDSIDGAFRFFTDGEDPLASIKSPKFEYQLKGYSLQVDPAEGDFGYQLKAKNYNDLRSTKVTVPRILVVLLMPEQPADWLAHHAHLRMELFYHAYWVSLYGEPALEEGQESRTVRVPIGNEFTVGTVRDFIRRIETTGTVSL